uniref:Uncharacterized protein n=1 Tax=Oryza rufipogon TaxID=4529 RepID=A0A0E0NNJ0_ORYRU
MHGSSLQGQVLREMEEEREGGRRRGIVLIITIYGTLQSLWLISCFSRLLLIYLHFSSLRMRR